MDALPALEVVADRVSWDWDVRTAAGHHGGVNSADTVASGFSRVSIRAPSPLVDVFGGELPGLEMPAVEALMRIVRHAPPTLLACALGLGASPKRRGQQQMSLQMSIDYAISNPSVYESAAELAEGLRRYAAGRVKLRVDEQSQVVHFARKDAA